MSYRKHLMTSDEPPSELYKAVELGTNLAEVGMDCISRQAAIDALDEIEAEVADGYGYQYAKWREYFVEMPPAEPATNCSEFPNSSDTISRQAAIETVMECYDNDELFDVYEDRLNELPSAQPEIIRCKDCKYAEYIDDVKTLWCTECGQGRTVAPNDFCSYAERRENGRLNQQTGGD